MTRSYLSAVSAVLLLVTLAAPALAGQRAQAPAAPVRPQPPTPPQGVQQPQVVQMVPIQDDRGARDTREWFQKVMEQYPPSVREVLRLDTSLLSRPDYLATYPALAAFLEQHPEVAHNPAYFVGTPDQREEGPVNAQIEAIRAWRGFGEFIPVVAIVFIITSALAGIIRTLLDQRRWQRAAKMHMEVQNKLLDRFAGSNELLAYLETPTGRTLTDLQLPGLASVAARPMDAPVSRIFWPLQTGIVVTAAGIGLSFLGRRMGFMEVSEPIAGIGALVVAIGLGFVVSAAASFLLSHRLGLVPAGRSDLGRGAPDA